MGAALSCADLLAVLYGDVLHLDAENFQAPEQDTFLLSAGHKCLALYAALIERGIVPESVLDTYNQFGSPVPGHPDMEKLPGVQFSSGSLGHGLPVGCGIAVAGRMRGAEGRVFVLMGDGEHGEGSVWESVAFAAQNHLDNLIAIVDENGLQINGTTREILFPSSLATRYQAFGWAVREADGNSCTEIRRTLSALPFEKGRPSVLIAHTIKGKGLPFAENDVRYHHWNPTVQEREAALQALSLAEKRYRNQEGGITHG